ncbi:UvrD-helicase domain-containing protein [Globicatella sulfidifaciens]|uniref:DNA 3'-5' helicase n=1 Tax=Globicatella sulfidifaciens TaxID=136093 RepID=A0A7X8C4B8_9LACT|nr:UvrD-helicase domain-containing protein [Globicatella sulfidifaciens]NLJ18435.1 UvrD-helicase domain-containing protein [Globicatella sulfidifaciens]
MTGKLTMLSAGAGAGKTYRLSAEILKSIQNGVPPENIVATTFTTKAADELIERVRLRLLESGDSDAAARILDGYVGTMNSVFGRLLREFALEMGLSPVQKVLPESESSVLFNTVADEVIMQFYSDYREVFIRLGLDNFFDDNNWQKKVLQVLELARENGMSPEDVQACAEYSWEIMASWLPDPLPNPDELDDELKSKMIVALPQLKDADATKKTASAVEALEDAIREWDQFGFISWNQWAKLSKLSPAKKSIDIVSPINGAASVHDRHPRLHQDMKQAMYAVFQCASEAMELYKVEKSKRGLIDFTDQEALALELLKDEQNIEVLKERISAVFIDEFQDSSPLQIALNMQLRELSENATWVGDVKQAIYGFRGTDPELMQTVMTSIDDLEIEILDASYRSRKSLVDFVNAIFVPVFESKEMPADRIALDPKREDKSEQALAIETWAYSNSKNKNEDAAHIALGVQKVLRQTEKYQIVDKTTHKLRPLKGGDIAILCRANDECVKIAEALSKLGIHATVGESGLLDTPEVVFAVAALRYLVDPRDTLAISELIHFSSEKGEEGSWLSDWLDFENRANIIKSEPIIKELDKVRGKIVQMSPSEVLDLALVVSRSDEIALSWGQGEQRLANLDALRKLAVTFEDVAGTNGATATITGFLLFLDDTVRNDRELNLVAESTDENAVRVLTYHKAKGLEWPFVILNSLEKSSERSKLPVFDEITAVSTTKLDVKDPLDGRRLYYWPWPYGKQTKNVSLDSYALDAPELISRQQQLIQENQRLMYVGMTRARDYLVFAARNFSKVEWLQELTDDAGVPVIQNLGVSEDDNSEDSIDDRLGSIVIKGEEFPCKVRVLSIEEELEQLTQEAGVEEQVFVGKTIEATQFVPARFSPSMVKDETSEDENKLVSQIESGITKIHRIGNRLPLSGNPDMATLGDMIHAFLAVDNVSLPQNYRLVLAEELIERYGITALSTESLLEASNRLQQFIDERYPDLVFKYSEWPIHLRKGLQKASGWIDLLIDTPKGWVIIDHKSFPGKEVDWLLRGNSYLPQLRTYAEALHKATDRTVSEAWIHMPVVGTMIQFAKDDLI